MQPQTPRSDHGGRRISGDVSASVSLSGEMDIYALPDLERQFAALGGPHVVIDLADVRLVSAAFIGALVRLRRRLPDSRIDVVGANLNVKRTFRAVGAEMLVGLF